MSKTILIVDDSRSIREMVKFVLEEHGYRVVEAENGQAALDKARVESFSLVLVDINMPIMDGFSLIKHLRTMPAYQSTPLLVLTTNSNEETKNKGRQAGATGWLVKPFDPDRLLTVIGKVI